MKIFCTEMHSHTNGLSVDALVKISHKEREYAENAGPAEAKKAARNVVWPADPDAFTLSQTVLPTLTASWCVLMFGCLVERLIGCMLVCFLFFVFSVCWF